MNKTKIEWCDYTWNPIKGQCKFGCGYCYAVKMSKRFKWNPEPRLDEKELHIFEHKELPMKSKIFVCSTHELFGWWIHSDWRNKILKVIKENPHYTFIVLTKMPVTASCYDFPNNCWVGTSIDKCRWDRLVSMFGIGAKIKFVSFEPLLEDMQELLPMKSFKDLDWVIVGGLSGERNKTNITKRQEWAKKIISVAKQNNIPVFVKDNLRFEKPIREFPEVSR